MRKMRRFAAIAAAAAMTACMAVPMTSVFAAANAGEISFTTETVGTHTYTAYKIFNGTVDATDGKLNGLSWAITGADADAITANVKDFVDALKADTTVVGKNDNDTPDDDSDDTDITLGDLFADCTYEAPSVAEVLQGVADKSDAAEAFAKFVANHATNLPATESSDGVIALASDGDDTDGDANDGYYVVAETDFTQNSANGGGARTAYLLGVYDASAGAELDVKSSIPVVEKKVLENTKAITDKATYETSNDKWNDVADYNIGDPVPFKLYGTMPDTLEDYKGYYYCFTDTLGDEFGTPTGVKVTVGNATITENDGNCRIAITGNDITVSFENIKAYDGVDKDTVVTVEYTAVLTTDAEIGLPGQENKVKLSYSNNPNVDWAPNTEDTDTDKPEDTDISETPEDKVIVFTYELDVTKVDAATKKVLADAEFVLYRVKGTGDEAVTEYVQIDASGFVTGWTTTKPTTGNLKSDANGEFKVVGLDDGTYFLKETKQPSGYNILEDAIELVISATTVNNQTWTTTADAALTGLSIDVDGKEAAGNTDTGVVEATVENSSGSTLPSTGGIGTTIFYVVGGALAAGAGVSLIAKKRMKNED